jgi:acetolactate synthase-1/2/3 large subunit
MLSQFGIYPIQEREAKSLFKRNGDLSGSVNILLSGNGENCNGLVFMLGVCQNKHLFIQKLSTLFGVKSSEISRVISALILKYEKNCLMSGAEAVAYILVSVGVKYVFAYPGTSELALCDSIIRMPGITLVNGRGDKESAFMSAGGSLMNPAQAVSILHGARGVTNAVGAIANTRRNEISTVFIVGLPSTYSQKYLPPHGETGLISAIGQFAKYVCEISDVAEPHNSAGIRLSKASKFIKTIIDGIQASRTTPYGPTVIGIPQDALEKCWIPISLFKDIALDSHRLLQINSRNIKKAVRLIKTSRKPVILVDDFFYKNPLAKEFLSKFAEYVSAPVLQIWYRRGPMLFESVRSIDNPYFIGRFDASNLDHKKIMTEADLLITLEDRNAYERVVGILPKCTKIAITSNSVMTRKNGYLNGGDLLIEGEVCRIVKLIVQDLDIDPDKRLKVKHLSRLLNKKKNQFVIQPRFRYLRGSIASSLASAFNSVDKPVLVDDSQMFGGLIAEYYDLYPKKLRVFGDHGGFIGGGMALAAGLSYCEPDSTVFCTLGDQSFINAIQTLVFVSQAHPHIVYIVCNNGKSVSLTKQMSSQDKIALNRGQNKFLKNVPGLSYTILAAAFGLTTFQIDCRSEDLPKGVLQKQLNSIFKDATSSDKPALIELILPSSLDAWEGIWITKGNEGVKSTRNFPL